MEGLAHFTQSGEEATMRKRHVIGPVNITEGNSGTEKEQEVQNICRGNLPGTFQGQKGSECGEWRELWVARLPGQTRERALGAVSRRGFAALPPRCLHSL